MGKLLLISFLSLAITIAGSVRAEEFRFSPRPNKAHLIHWRTWSNKIFQEAKKTGKPILLSLSAIWCHWCHVMDETTYSDPEIIRFINEHFIPVRVDADRRPDIDSLYNQGGWPSTVFLTDEGEIIVGDTYVPPQRMMAILKEIYELYRTRKKDILKELERLKEVVQAQQRQQEKGKLDFTLPALIEKLFQRYFDPEYGGFGQGQKFPNPWAVEFLIERFSMTKSSEAKRMVIKTLDNMANSELYDSIEGAFFRYATRRDWSEPHYEKMLKLNAQLITNYAHAYLVFNKKEYLKIAIQTYKYLKDYFYEKNIGLFANSQDADEDYYKSTNRKKLKPPYIDKTFFADSNAPMVSASVALLQATADKQYLHMAEKLADNLIKKLYTPKQGVFHYYLEGKPYLPGILRDNATVAICLYDLYTVTGKKEYIKLAIEIGEFILQQFYKNGQLYSTTGTEGVHPITGGIMRRAANIKDTFLTIVLFGELMHYKNSFKTPWRLLATRYAGEPDEYLVYAGIYGSGILWGLEEPLELKIVSDDPLGFLKALYKIYLPKLIVKVYNPSVDQEMLKEAALPIEERLYVCKANRCLKPLKRTEDIREILLQIIQREVGEQQRDF